MHLLDLRMSNITSNTTNCLHFGAYQLFGPCSGNGECVHEPTPWVEGSMGKCVCNEGWTGRVREQGGRD